MNKRRYLGFSLAVLLATGACSDGKVHSNALARADSGAEVTLCLPSPGADGLTTFSEIAVRNSGDETVDLTSVDTNNSNLTVTDLYTFPLSGELPGSGMAWEPPSPITRTVPAGEARGVNLRIKTSGSNPVQGHGFDIHYRLNDGATGVVSAGTNYRILGAGQHRTC